MDGILEAPPWLAPTSGGVGALAGWTAADGRPRLASSGSDGTIQIWDPEAGCTVGPPLVRHEADVLCLVAWTFPGGRLLASSDEDGAMFVWDLDADVPTGIRLDGHRGWVQAAAFWLATDGAPRLASAGADGTLRLWDPLTGAPIGQPLLDGRDRLVAVASWATADGARLAVADDQGIITVWDAERGVSVGERTMCHANGIWTLAAWTSADGAPRLASGGYDGTIHIWDPESGLPIAQALDGHTNWVPTLVAWTPEGGATRLISASTDGTVRVWDAQTGAPMDVSLTGAGGLPTLTRWVDSAGRPRLAVLGSGGAIRSYDLETGQAVGELLFGHVAGMWALAGWPEADGVRLARGGDDGLIRIWNADTGQAVGRPLAGHTAAVWALVTWPDAGSTRIASAGDDGTIRIWDTTTWEPVGQPMTGHSGWVPGLVTWRRPDGSVGLASAGIDGTVRRWDPATQTEIGEPMRGHDGWVVSIAAWDGPDGARLATGGEDGTIRLWDPVTGDPIGPARNAHDGWVRALALWHGASRTVLVSGGYDGTIRLWDAVTGKAFGSPLAGHNVRVSALAVWTGADGRARLASADSGGSIRLWDLDTRAPIGEPLAGHAAGIWALSSWHTPGTGARLASAGQDGSVRLWDPELGHAIRTIEIGPVAIWGISDAPTRRDVIGRQPLAHAIANQLCRPPGEVASGVGAGAPHGDGPAVISIEGPWGCGKTTLMNLVREQLPAPSPARAVDGADERITVRTVLRAIHQYADRPEPGETRPATARTATVTAWFNPWAYQSGEQVWAGLANEIIEAAADVLYPTESERARYWLVRNLGRIDRYALGRSLRQRTRSPILSVGAVALLIPSILAILDLNRPVPIAGVLTSPFVLAMMAAVALVVAGGAHTMWQRWFGEAVTFLPIDLLTGPVTDETAVDGDEADPLRRARTGALYLHQHNIGDLVDDLAAAGYDLVVFVDDIDRCRPGTIAEVFEAVNLFLSNVASRSGLRAHFVVGLDSAVVASHLDTAYAGHSDPTVALHGDDPSPGWAFLRKLIQLPVLVPQVPDSGLRSLVDVVTAPEAPPAGSFRPLGGTPAPARTPGSEAAEPPSSPAPAPVPAPRTPVDVITWRSAERHPEVRELLFRRLSAQSSPSVREAKRLLNLWQFYERMLETVDPPSEPDVAVARARHLIILAEIVTRWPALQRSLHRQIDGRRGLQLLAASAGDTTAWRAAVTRLGIPDQPALARLQALLADYDGPEVAELAARLI